MIDTEHGGKFVTYVTAPSYAWERPDHHDQMWAYLRQQLTRKFYDEIFINFLNGGWYTFNLLFVQENPEQYGELTRLGVVGNIFKVQEQTRVIETVTFDYSLPVLKKEWKILCAGCGNIFTPDRRGGCSACGSPADWIKNWTLEVK